jgi:hypothetical protein
MENLYTTSDLILASVLITCGYSVDKLTKLDGQRFAFSFPLFNSANEIIYDYERLYQSKRAFVEASAFYQNVRFLKSLMRNHVDNFPTADGTKLEPTTVPTRTGGGEGEGVATKQSVTKKR